MPSINKIVKFLKKEFLYNGHTQSASAVGIILTTTILFDISVSWDIALVTYLLFYTIYFYNRVKEIDVDALFNPERTIYFRTYQGISSYIFLFLLTLAIGTTIYFSKVPGITFSIVVIVAGISYSHFFKELTKYIVGFKNIFVASVFAGLVFFPHLYYHYEFNSGLIALLVFSLYVFTEITIMQIALDLKDKKTDKQQGLLTLASLWGNHKTIKYLLILSTVSTITIPLIFTVFIPILPLLTLTLILTLPLKFYSLKLCKEKKRPGYVVQSVIPLSWPILILLVKQLV